MTLPQFPVLPETVYHYTSMDGLIGIISERSIRATAIDYLNDVKERRIFIDAVGKNLAAFKMLHNRLDGRWSDALMEPEESMILTPTNRPFVSSFSEERDALVLWRAYCPDGNGVCIGLKTANLRAAKFRNAPVFSGVAFRAISYLEEADKHLVSEIMESMYKNSCEVEDSYPDGWSPTVYADYEFICNVYSEASFYKHYSFQHEKEYRLLYAPEVSPQCLRFRSKKSVLIPYVNFEIPTLAKPKNIGDVPVWDAIRSITVGPTVNMRLSVAAVKSYLLGQNLQVDVYESSCPYREF